MRIFSDKMLLVSSSMLAQVMRVLATVVMARFIGPKENGAYYLIFIYTGFIMSLGDFAVPQSLVQIQGFSDRVLLDTAILLEGAIYALYGVVTVVAGLFITHHYADPRLWKVAIIIAITNILTATYAVQLASLNRNLKFGAESRQNVVLSVSTAPAGIGFAVAGWGVYAIALQLLIGQVAANVVLQFKVPLKWPSHGSWTVAKRYMKLGIPLSGAFVCLVRRGKHHRSDHHVLRRRMGRWTLVKSGAGPAASRRTSCRHFSESRIRCSAEAFPIHRISSAISGD